MDWDKIGVACFDWSLELGSSRDQMRRADLHNLPRCPPVEIQLDGDAQGF